MSVDWFTTIAQIINFLVLVYLLKRFLYQPIVTAMQRREESIAGRMQEAEDKAADAQQQIEEYQQKQHGLELQREAMLADARQEADAARAQLMDDMRADIARIRRRWQQEVEREQQSFLKDARQVIADQVCEVARQALRDLANAELEEQMVQVFARRLAELTAADKAALTTAGDERLILETHFALGEASRKGLLEQLQQQLSPALELHYQQTPDLLCGIRLKRGGFKLEWNLAEYLTDLDSRLRNKLAVRAGESGDSKLHASD